jgi:hypothetical protein
VSENDFVKPGTPIVKGFFVNDIFYIDLGRILLLALLGILLFTIYKAKSSNKIEA